MTRDGGAESEPPSAILGPPPLDPTVEHSRAAVKRGLFSALDRIDESPAALSHYRLSRVIGSGSAGVVWAAIDTRSGRDVALKVLRSEDAIDGSGRDRLFREARILAKLEHPGIVRVEDAFALEDGTTALVMELLTGESLARRLERRGRLPPEEVREILGQAADALAEVHGAGVVHRDLNPGNVFVVDADGGPRVKLLDFGLARRIELDPESRRLTGTGTVLGSPVYMAPEQIRGRRLDGRADVYSLACIGYQLLVGRPPVSARTLADTLVDQLTRTPDAIGIAAPDVTCPPELEAALMRALEKDPARRFATATAFGIALHGREEPEAVEASVPPDGRSGRRWMYLVGLVLLIAVATLVLAVVGR